MMVREKKTQCLAMYNSYTVFRSELKTQKKHVNINYNAVHALC